MPIEELVARTGLSASEIAAAASSAPLVNIPRPQPWYADRAWFQSARDGMVQAVRRVSRKASAAARDCRGRNCAAANMPRRRRLCWMRCWRQPRKLSAEGEIVRLRGHKVVLKEDEEQARGAIERAFEAAGLAVPFVPEVLAKSGLEAARARSLLQILLRERTLVRVNEELVFHRAAIEALRAMLAAHKGAALQRRHVQGMDRHFAQVCDSVAGIPGPRTCDAPGRRRAAGAVSVRASR